MIGQKLKAAAWIKYSQTYKCYVMAHSAGTIAKTSFYFGSDIVLNTRCLNRPQRLSPTQGTTVLAAAHGSAPLPKKESLPVVQLIPLQHENTTVIGLQFK